MFELYICSTYRLFVAHEFAFELTHGLCLSTTRKNDGCFSLILYPICLYEFLHSLEGYIIGDLDGISFFLLGPKDPSAAMLRNEGKAALL